MPVVGIAEVNVGIRFSQYRSSEFLLQRSARIGIRTFLLYFRYPLLVPFSMCLTMQVLSVKLCRHRFMFAHHRINHKSQR